MHARTLLILGALAMAACPQGFLLAAESPSTTIPPEPNDSLPAASGGRSGLTGYVAAEGRLFFHDPLFADQEEHNASLVAQPEYYYQWESGGLFTFTPFGRVDSADSERTHWDIRELYYLHAQDWWSFRFGLARVFWGATEFVHLVDVVNQTDLVEHIDGEDKLGQPMLQFTASRDWGTLDIFVLPYFRERTFPGQEGRLRPALVIDTDDAVYREPRRTKGQGPRHPVQPDSGGHRFRRVLLPGHQPGPAAGPVGLPGSERSRRAPGSFPSTSR